MIVINLNVYFLINFNKIINTKFCVTEVSTETIPISTSSYFFYQTETQTDSNENSNTVDATYERLTFTCKR